ncbi:haloacid dehalogenase [Burkholderia multivorans]|uniref:HAD-superfamily hydrolase n=1 Tax=Burkholderia multivorans CGD2 TaxID=513052 RepID=B9BY32_9BURK|nr:haloacid dehalogenase [Burkholderia multivorans]EEE04359.1 HAD-superfamily hydrolase [Burkholderia multivorans CGD2]EEE14662.1 HAD-superfamily hydrolase [Burkholderia multivorans CGD2M]PRE13235.1 haloacid dehalogenase [Burkholderia multivorans]PRF88119.1 haloacid dehalogenase [Burkholderia multivorans]
MGRPRAACAGRSPRAIAMRRRNIAHVRGPRPRHGAKLR